MTARLYSERTCRLPPEESIEASSDCLGHWCRLCRSINAQKGVVNSAPNIPALDGFYFDHALAKVTDAHVRLSNVVNAALYGEYKLGTAVGYKHVLGIFLGTGIGGAIIIDGKLYLGATGHAGDIGHYLLQPLGPLA